jgi:hypothetical protein
MGFILKVFFSGLIAFVPSENGKELTVLLLDAPQARHGSSHAGIAEHKPVLLARAAGCDGNCTRTNRAVSTFLYPDLLSAAASNESLALAIDRGVVWQLAGSDLSLGIPKEGVKLTRTVSSKGKSVPDNESERADFGWVASLTAIDPAVGKLDPAIFSAHPPKGLIVARLKLTSGDVSTYSVIQVNGKVMPIDFRPLAGNGTSYTRAVASWVQAEIHVPGNSLKIVETNFAGGKKREVSLKPLNGAIDIAVLNVSQPPTSKRTAMPEPGLHFARFWDLTAGPPASGARPIPQFPLAQVEKRDFEALHVDSARRKSDLLHAIFPDPRSPYDQILCPMSQYP